MQKCAMWAAVLSLTGIVSAAGASSGQFQITAAASKNPNTNPIYTTTDASNLLSGSIQNNGILQGSSSVVNFYYSPPPPYSINPYASPFSGTWGAFPVTPAVTTSFAMRADGTVVIPKSGYYDFGVNSDDGFSLQVGSLNLIQASGRAAGNTIGAAYFTAGSYPVDLLYFQTDGYAVVELYAGSGNGATPYATFSAAPAGTFQLVGGSGTGALQLAAASVPEPATAGLLAIGALSLLTRRRRQA